MGKCLIWDATVAYTLRNKSSLGKCLIWDVTVADTLRKKSFITILKIHPLWYTSCFVFLYHNGCIFKFENTPVVVYCSIFFSIPQRVYFENTPVEVHFTVYRNGCILKIHPLMYVLTLPRLADERNRTIYYL